MHHNYSANEKCELGSISPFFFLYRYMLVHFLFDSHVGRTETPSSDCMALIHKGSDMALQCVYTLIKYYPLTVIYAEQ